VVCNTTSAPAINSSPTALVHTCTHNACYAHCQETQHTQIFQILPVFVSLFSSCSQVHIFFLLSRKNLFAKSPHYWETFLDSTKARWFEKRIFPSLALTLSLFCFCAVKKSVAYTYRRESAHPPKGSKSLFSGIQLRAREF